MQTKSYNIYNDSDKNRLIIRNRK